ncbi:hypothetical protein VR611_13165 [Aquirufa nivalisilvae]
MKILKTTAINLAAMMVCAWLTFSPTISNGSTEPGDTEANNSFGIRYAYSMSGLSWKHMFNQVNHFEAFILPISNNFEKQFNYYGGRYIHNFPQTAFPFTPFVFAGVGLSTYSRFLPEDSQNSVPLDSGKYFAYSIGQGVEFKLGNHLSLSGDVAISKFNNEPNQMLGIIRLGCGVQYVIR